MLDKNLYVVIGAKLNDQTFEVRVCIKSYESCIQLTLTEWRLLCGQEYQIMKAFQSECAFDIEPISDHTVMVIRNRGCMSITNNRNLVSLRLTQLNFHHLMHLKFCINNWINKLEAEVEYMTWTLLKVVETCTNNLREKEYALNEIYESLAEQLSTHNRNTQLTNEDIKHEIMCVCMEKSSSIGSELYGVYLDEMIVKVKDSLTSTSDGWRGVVVVETQ